MMTTVTQAADYRWNGLMLERVVPTPRPRCTDDACNYREVTPHGLKAAAFVECRRCGHTGWLIVS